MVLVKMLMEIDPLPMIGSLVMAMEMISPSRREVSSVEQLRQSPRLVLPRFRLMAAVFRPESFLLIFFQGERLHIAEDGHRRPARGAHKIRGAPYTLVAGWWPPLVLSSPNIFLYPKNKLHEISGLLEFCRIGL